MKLDTIFLKANSPFGQYISTWIQGNAIQTADFKSDASRIDEGIDGIVVFSENQTVSKEIDEISKAFDFRQKPVHTIDINGTQMVAISNLELWIERNGCKKVLFIGDDVILKNPRLERILSELH